MELKERKRKEREEAKHRRQMENRLKFHQEILAAAKKRDKQEILRLIRKFKKKQCAGSYARTLSID